MLMSGEVGPMRDVMYENLACDANVWLETPLSNVSNPRVT